MTSNITGIFPTPISLSNIGREFNDKEGIFFTKNLDRMMRNSSNHTSIDRYVLDHEELTDLKLLIEEKLNDFYHEIYSPAGNSRLVITQSWINLTKFKEGHHRHNHPNSFVSGVLYLKSDKNLDKIIFHKNTYEQILIEPTKMTDYNCEDIGFNVGTGDLILFPSQLTHSVVSCKSNFRISLAFNSFIKGQIGDEVLLSQLTIN
jgi:uncharacterized protein (TIGR02466 family)